MFFTALFFMCFTLFYRTAAAAAASALPVAQTAAIKSKGIYTEWLQNLPLYP